MKTIKVGKHKIQIFSDIDDTPIGRYNQFNLYMLADSGIGSTLEDTQIRLNRIDTFLAAEELDSARTELINLQVNLYSIFEGISYPARAFVCLIANIDGKEKNDLSDEGIKETLNQLNEIGLTNKIVKETIQTQKKKLTDSLRDYFPSHFNGVRDLQYYATIKRISIEQLRCFSDPSREAQRFKLFKDYCHMIKPEVILGDKSSAYVRHEKTHNELYNILEGQGISRPEEISVMRFYTLIEQKEKVQSQTPVKNGR